MERRQKGLRRASGQRWVLNRNSWCKAGVCVRSAWKWLKGARGRSERDRGRMRHPRGRGVGGAGLGQLTESHLIHSPLFLHAGHRRRLLLVLCGQRRRMKPRGAPGGGAARARPAAGVAGGRGRRACASASGAGRGRRRGGASPPAGTGRGPPRQPCAHSPLFFFQGETSPGGRQ